MSIDEAITYAEEKEEEHGQLAEWLKELKTLREKNTPQKPRLVTGYMGAGFVRKCPLCGMKIPNTGVVVRYCCYCGQAID